METSPLVAGLNALQAQAVTTDHPRLLIIAGAGAGKTTVLARRVARLIQGGVPPSLILCVTFTRKSAEEMRARIVALLLEHGMSTRELPDIHTLHAWGARLLRAHPKHFGLTADFSILDDVDQEDVLRLVARDAAHPKADTAKPSTLRKDAAIQKAYAARLLEINAIDFDSIETFTLELLRVDTDVRASWVGRYRHLLVDEYQDTNLAQVAIVEGVRPENLAVIGDPRQAIYRFRGAEVGTILAHAADEGFQRIELVTNYRSVPDVVAYGNGCVQGPWAPMVSGRPAAGPAIVAHTCDVEAALVEAYILDAASRGRAWSDIAVLARNWRPLDVIRAHLEAAGIPVAYGGSEADPWSSPEGRNVARALLLCHNPGNDAYAALLADWGLTGRTRWGAAWGLRRAARASRRSVLQMLADETEAWGVVRHRLARVGPWSAVDHLDAVLEGLAVREEYTTTGLTSRVETIEALRADVGARCPTLDDFAAWWVSRSIADRVEAAPAGVSLLTVHGAKGLEWPEVILADVRAGVFPSKRKSSTPEDEAEDLRVFYVAVTRARDRLSVSVPAVVTDPWTWAESPAERSPYLDLPGGPGAPIRWAPQSWGGDRLIPRSML